MTLQNAIKIFEEKKVRSVWDDKTEEWYFAIGRGFRIACGRRAFLLYFRSST